MKAQVNKVVFKGSVTRDKQQAVSKFMKSGDSTILNKVTRFIVEGNKLILL